jgi:hypothetical protein
MNITDLFIRRPVLALVVSLVIIIAGLQAVRTLNVRQYPRSENAAVTVTTVYVGADAELVRGFVTAPLERAIAAADGVEYMESQSSLGMSTIKARLRLNFDSTKALAEIGSKVDQVRSDLPPEAEVPTINIESTDSEFASAYLSFSSDILQQNEITDYLVRVVQPRLSAVPAQRPTRLTCHADMAQARTDGRPEYQPCPGAPGTEREQLSGRPRQEQGSAHPGKPDSQYQPAHRGRVQEPGGARAGRRYRAPGGDRRRGAGRRRLRR